MIVCGECGSHEVEAGAAFCGACGAFLEFAGVRTDAVAAQEAERAAAVAAERAAQEAATERAERTARALEAAEQAAAAERAARLHALAGPASRPGPSVSPDDPSARPEASADQPAEDLGAVLPAAEARPQPVRPAIEPIRPGELICGDCGTGNEPVRNFCRRCGHSLASAQVQPQVGWWRRLTAWWRARRTLQAGERPARWRRRGSASGTRVRRRKLGVPMHWIGPVLILVTLAGAGVPSLRQKVLSTAEHAVTTVKRTVAPQYDAVRPVATVASSSQPAHPASQAVDGVVDTNWAEGQPGDGVGATLVLTFDRPVDLQRLGVRLGSTGSPDAFAREPRPERIRVSSGSTSQDVSLSDTADLQQKDIDLDDVTTLTVQILSVYGGQGGSAASIAELTAFRLR